MNANRQSASRYLSLLGRALVAVVFAAACLTLPVAPALAGGLKASPPSVTVSFDASRLESPAYVEDLHARLQNAAAKVCGGVDSRAGRSRSEVNSCLDKSLNRAVHDVDSAMLTAIHRQSRTGALCMADDH